MGQLSSVLKLSVLDGVTGPFRRISGVVSSFNRQTSSMMAPIRGMTGQILAFGAGYIGVTEGWSKTYTAAADAQAALSEIGIKADLSQAQLGVLQKRLADMSPRVNQFTSDLRAGVDTMLTMGLGADQAMGSIEIIGKTATATGASIEDLSDATVSAMQNFKVSADEVPRMLDGMTFAGNAGAFEMRDMSAHFAQLTASAKSVGMHGVDGVLDLAAALQVARRGAGDASTAANNLSNFLGKIMSPEVMKRFRGFGIDVTKELKKAHKQGVSPIEHFIKLVDKTTKGGQADLLGQLFGDKQVLDFVRPMLADFKDYIRIREDAERASGTVADAYARRMDDANQKVKSLKISLQNLGESIGTNLLAPIGDAAESLSKVFNTLDSRFTIFDEFKARFGGLMSGLGLGDGTDALKGIRDLIFGAEDASAAADKYGRLFGQFQEYGKAIREFAKDIADNPVGRFLGDLAGKGFKLALAAGSISLVAGAITALATGLAKITGITTAIGILRTVSKIGGILNDVKIPTLPGDSKNKPTPDKKPSSGGTGWKGFLALFQMFDAYANMPSTKEGIEELYKKNRDGSSGFNKWLDSKITTPWEWFRNRFVNDNSSHPYLNKDYDDGGRESSLDAYLGKDGTKNVPAVPTGWPTIFDKRFWLGAAADPNFNSRQHFGVETKAGGENGGSPRTTGEMLAGLDKPVTLDGPTISQLLQPSRGVQDVRVTNKQAPELRQTNNFYITEVSNAKDVAAAVMSDIGQASKAAVEAADTD